MNDLREKQRCKQIEQKRLKLRIIEAIQENSVFKFKFCFVLANVFFNIIVHDRKIKFDIKKFIQKYQISKTFCY